MKKIVTLIATIFLALTILVPTASANTVETTSATIPTQSDLSAICSMKPWGVEVLQDRLAGRNRLVCIKNVYVYTLSAQLQKLSHGQWKAFGNKTIINNFWLLGTKDAIAVAPKKGCISGTFRVLGYVYIKDLGSATAAGPQRKVNC